MALRARPRLNALPRPGLPPTGSGEAPKQPKPPSRQDKRQVAFFVDAATKRQIARLVLEEESSVQSLMAEAVNLLFQSRGMARIAEQKE